MKQFTFLVLVLCSRAVLGRMLVCHDVSSPEELLRLANLLSDKRERNSTAAENLPNLHVPEYEYALDPSNVSSVESSAAKNASLESGNWIFMTPAPGRSKTVSLAGGASNETVGVQYVHPNLTESRNSNETAGVEYADDNPTTPVINGSDSLVVDNTTAFALNEGVNPEITTAGATTRLIWNPVGSKPLVPHNGLLTPLPAPAPLPLPAVRPPLMAPPLNGSHLVNDSYSAPPSSFHVVGASKGSGPQETGNGSYEPPLIGEGRYSSEERLKDRRSLLYPPIENGTQSDNSLSGYKYPLASPIKKEKSRMQLLTTVAPPKKKRVGNPSRYQYFRPSQ